MANRIKKETGINGNRFTIFGIMPTNVKYDTKEIGYFPLVMSEGRESNVKQDNFSRKMGKIRI